MIQDLEREKRWQRILQGGRVCQIYGLINAQHLGRASFLALSPVNHKKAHGEEEKNVL